MLDDSDRLHDTPRLLELLSHYATLAKADHAVWQDRLMQMDGVEPRELSRLHGELIACDWIEQNTGQTSTVGEGVVAACYRVTLNGLREYRRVRGIDLDLELAEAPAPKPARKRKAKSNSAEAVVVVGSEDGAP